MEIFAIFFGAQRTKVPNNRRNRCWVHDWGNVIEVSPHYRHKLHLRLELGDPRQVRIQYERDLPLDEPAIVPLLRSTQQ